PVAELAALENRILAEANQLDIGPMGFGGKLTVGSCKVGARNRLPASFFVSVAYMCWAYRRRGVVLDPAGEVREWLYQTPGEFDAPGEPGVSRGEPGVLAPGDSGLIDLGVGGRTAVTLQTPLTEA